MLNRDMKKILKKLNVKNEFEKLNIEQSKMYEQVEYNYNLYFHTKNQDYKNSLLYKIKQVETTIEDMYCFGLEEEQYNRLKNEILIIKNSIN